MAVDDFRDPEDNVYETVHWYDRRIKELEQVIKRLERKIKLQKALIKKLK